ncbi:hypothetical protein ACLKA7_009866 [Drosophila subpalustris]
MHFLLESLVSSPLTHLPQHQQSCALSGELPDGLLVAFLTSRQPVSLILCLILCPADSLLLRNAKQCTTQQRGKHNTQSDFYIKTTSTSCIQLSLVMSWPPLCCHYDDYQGTLIAAAPPSYIAVCFALIAGFIIVTYEQRETANER